MSRAYADAAIVFDDTNVWDADAPWWSATQDFLEDDSGVPDPTYDMAVSEHGVVTWANAADNASLVYVLRRESGTEDPFALIGIATADKTSFSDETATVNGDFDYEIYAANGFGNSDPVESDDTTIIDHNAFTTINPENFVNEYQDSSYFLGTAANFSRPGLYGMGNAGWAHYSLDFPDQTTQMMVQTSLDAASGSFSVYVDPDVDGNTLDGEGSHAYVTRTVTGGYLNIWQSFDVDISEGHHEIYIEGGPGCSITDLRFGSDITLGPAQGRELHASSRGDSIHLRWQDWSNTETNYVIQASTDGVTFETIDDIDATDTDYVDGTGHIFNYDWIPEDASRYTFQVIATRVCTIGGSRAVVETYGDRSNFDSASTATTEVGTEIQAEDAFVGDVYWRTQHQTNATVSGGHSSGDDNVIFDANDHFVFRYRGIDFGAGSDSMDIRLASDGNHTQGYMEVWIDGDGLNSDKKAYDDGGVKIGCFEVDSTGGYNTFGTLNGEFDPDGITGVHDLFLKFFVTPSTLSGHDWGLATIDWFRINEDHPLPHVANPANRSTMPSSLSSDHVIDLIDATTTSPIS